MKWHWPPWRRRHADTIDEARGHLERLERRDAEIGDLSKKLHEAQRRNHFSILVDQAIRRARET